MVHKQIGRLTIKKLLRNIEVEIDDAKAILKSLAGKFKAENTLEGATQWRRIQVSNYNRLKGALNLVYMSSDLDLADAEMNKINVQIFDILKLTYYD